MKIVKAKEGPLVTTMLKKMDADRMVREVFEDLPQKEVHSKKPLKLAENASLKRKKKWLT